LKPGSLIDIAKVDAHTFTALYDLGNNNIGTYQGGIQNGAIA
jgi:hypothetical protein